MRLSHHTRLLTGFFLLSTVVAAVRYLPELWLAVFVACVMLIAAWEWLCMLYRARLSVVLQLLTVLVLMFALLFGVPQAVSHAWLLYSCIAWWSAAFILIAVWRAELAKKPALLWFLRLGVLLAVPTAGLALLEWHRLGWFYLLYVILLAATADTAAFYVGRLFGRRKLAPALSPNKTQAGFWGAMSAVFLLALATAFLWELPWLSASSFILASLIAGLLSVVGDLAESMIKRCADCKSSGRLLPGHGGMLDRVDGLLAAAPVFFLTYAPLAAP